MQFPLPLSSLFPPLYFRSFLPQFRLFPGWTGKHPDQPVPAVNPANPANAPDRPDWADSANSAAFQELFQQALPLPPRLPSSAAAAVNAGAEKVLIVGGASGAGLALARTLLADGAEVTLVGRSADRLANARESLASTRRLRTMVADISQEEQVERLFGECGSLHHIVTTAAGIQGACQRLGSLDIALARRIIDARFIGPLLLAKYGAPCLTEHGSITLMSGTGAYRAAARGPAVAAIHGALESLAYALAVELGPIRVNVVSPSWPGTSAGRLVTPDDAKAAPLGGRAARFAIDRARPLVDVADAIRFLMRNGLVTGTVLRVGGRHRQA